MNKNSFERKVVFFQENFDFHTNVQKIQKANIIIKILSQIVQKLLLNCFEVLIMSLDENKTKISILNFRLNFGHFDQKMRFFAENFFDPTHFSAGNRQTGKKFRPNVRNIQNLSQKFF